MELTANKMSRTVYRLPRNVQYFLKNEWEVGKVTAKGLELEVPVQYSN